MKVARKIPTVMFSQHPDHASKPYWHIKPFIETHYEVEECFRMFSEFGIEEMMWDWEGKLVDESVIERLWKDYFEFFRRKPLGEEVFLTFRVPNPRVESGYRLGRAFMVILSASQLAHKAGLPKYPLFEVILPMTETAGDILSLQKSFQKISQATQESFNGSIRYKKQIEVIPLFESIGTILRSGKILREYVKLAKTQLAWEPYYLRPFCARSDPALNSGIVTTTLAVKWALSEFAKFTAETGIITYPIIAAGSLPFRGGLTPETAYQFLQDFSGVKTLVLQSAFRYDYPIEKVKSSIRKIKEQIPKSFPEILPTETYKKIREVIPWFEIPYREMVEKITPAIREISRSIPARRERSQHIGLFGYSRQVGKTSLPRAIGFTASCYSLGIPPEFFGLAAGFKKSMRRNRVEMIENLYPSLKSALERAGRYLRKESLKQLGLKEMAGEIKDIEEYLGRELGAKTDAEKNHAELAGKIVTLFLKGKNFQSELEEAALLRRSLG